MTLASAYVLYCLVETSDDREKSKIKVSADWYVAVEHRRLSSIRDYLC